MSLKRWLQEPLLHFLIIGAALFALFYQVTEPEAVSGNRIVISEQDIDRMITLFERKLLRLPSEQELKGLVAAQIREEVLYREALAMGLDQDDTIVRRRMAQKVEFMFNDLVDAAEPTAEELEQFLGENPDKFIESARTSFTHVYLSADERGDKVMTDAQKLLVALNSKQDPIDPDTAGDAFMFGYAFDNQSDDQISRMFGSDFAASLGSLATGHWQGPVASGYGLHLVNINDRIESWLPPLADIRDSVLYEVLAERRQQANSAFYKTLLERYDVIVEQPLTQQSLVEMELTQ